MQLQLGYRLAWGEDLDPVLLQVAQEVVRLLAGELRVLDRGRKRVRRQEPPLLGLDDDRLQLLQLDHGYVRGGQQTLKLLAQLASQRPYDSPRSG